MDVQGFRLPLAPEESGDAWKVRARDARSVVALRMRSKIAEDGDGRFLIPERYQRNLWVNNANRFGPN